VGDFLIAQHALASVEGAEDVEATRQRSDELAVLGRKSFAESVLEGALEGRCSRDEVADIAHGAFFSCGEWPFILWSKAATPSALLQRRKGDFGLRTCKAAMLQMRALDHRGCRTCGGFSFTAQFARFFGRAAGPGKHRRLACASHSERTKLAKEPTLPKDIAELSFEDALKELEGIVQQLERGQVKLDEAISAYERGALLKRHCEQKLAEAKMKVEKIVFAADGSVASQPAELA
jgi:exodeoxyribonuclease VII small subunit